MKQSLQNALEHGIPYYGMHESIPHQALGIRIAGAEEACTAVHAALLADYASKQPNVHRFGDTYSGEDGKYISYVDGAGQPLYRQWDSHRPASDIGVRSICPDFIGQANRTTIFHADHKTVEDFVEQGAPKHVIEALDALSLLNRFAISQVVLPYLSEIAQLYHIEPKSYIKRFYPIGKRALTLTRAILYRDTNTNEERHVGSDGEPLLIREHYDQSSYTVDIKQTSPGLQYLVDGVWRDAKTDVAVFRGAGEDFLPNPTPGALHRAVIREDQTTNRSLAMQSAGVRRIAYIAFISPSDDASRVVRPSSQETHPEAAEVAVL